MAMKEAYDVFSAGGGSLRGGGAYVDVKAVFNFHRRRGYYHFPPERLPGMPPRIPPMLPPGPMSKGQTPLSIAASAGHDAVVSLLLDHGARLNDREGEGTRSQSYHPAVEALLGCHESTLRLLIEQGAKTESPMMLFGGLINCAVAGQMSMLKLLIEFGVDINAGINGNNPLLWAVCRKPNYASMVEVLLDNGANIALVRGDEGRLLGAAIGSGTIETVHLLVKHGANYHESLFDSAIIRYTPETVRLLLDHGARVDFASLTSAVRSKNCDILELLLDHGFDLNLRDSKGCTILHHAIRRCGIHPSMFRGSSATMCCFSPSRVVRCPPGCSPPHVVAYCRGPKDDDGTAKDMVRCLVRRSADVNAMDRKRQTPLYFAWKYASPGVQQLWKMGLVGLLC